MPDPIIRPMSPEQAREQVNARQILSAYLEARDEQRSLRGSMVWATPHGEAAYLVQSYYDSSGNRKQRSLGLRDERTEGIKAGHDKRKAAVEERVRSLSARLKDRAGVNRALGLGRVPMPAAKVIRRIERAGLLGKGLRVLGTNAIHAYEAAAGAYLDDGLMATGDVDVLMDSRRRLQIAMDEGFDPHNLMEIIRKADRSYTRSKEPYRAINKVGYMVDLIRPLRDPPWVEHAASVTGDTNDLQASEIHGLVWHENARPFEATVIDTDGVPLRIVTSDPRDFAVHKLWLSNNDARDPVKRDRDRRQASAVAKLVIERLPHLGFDPDGFRNFPREIVENALSLFDATDGTGLDL